MADISALFERLKKNKLFIPAVAIGVVGGGYLLLKGGGLNGGITSQDTAALPGQNSAPGAPSAGGGGDTSGQTDAAIAALTQQQQTFQSSLVDQFNALVSSVTGALSGQQSQTQAALDAIGQQVSAQAQQQQAVQAPLSSNSFLPDFASLFAALQSVPAQQGAYNSPSLSGFGGAGKLTVKPGLLPNPGRLNILPRPSTNYTPARPTPNQRPTLRPLNPPRTITRLVVTPHAASNNRSGNRLIG